MQHDKGEKIAMVIDSKLQSEQGLDQVDADWRSIIDPILSQPPLQDLMAFLASETAAGKVILPPVTDRYRAFIETPFAKVQVVILGQDPYHGLHQAHGLAFSVLPGNAIPPSLRNIYQSLSNDIGFVPPSHGCLAGWAQQGVLLLNTLLSVELGKPLAHQGRGWERLTDEVIRELSRKKAHLVFMLWGKDAQKKQFLIDGSKHLVLTASHPSPLAAYRGFMTCQHFSKANGYLALQNRPLINWTLG